LAKIFDLQEKYLSEAVAYGPGIGFYMATNFRTASPKAYKCRKGLLSIIHEEEAILCLWAESRLLQWEYPIAWINSPVVGKHRWLGDLWGIDSQGDLIII
jgi:hypothetical protein